MAKYASKVIDQAKKWIGKKESDGSFKEIVDCYNNHKPLAQGYKVKYTDEWCATFVSAVAIKLGYTDIIPTECSCQRMIELLKKLGSFVENENRTPNVGDIIFFDWSDNGSGDNTGWADHVGFVETVSNGKITTIEGNYNSGVARRTLDVNGKYIRGYGVPKYDKEVVNTPPTTTTSKKSVDVIAKEVIDGKWGVGDDRKARLTNAGYNYSEVQAKVNALLSGAKSKEPSYTTYKVQRGDTLWSIAKKYMGDGSKYTELAKYNNIANPNVIVPGTVIKIPR